MAQTDIHIDIPTEGHGNSMTESAQRADSVKIKIPDEQQTAENYFVWQLQRTLIVLVYWELSFQILEIILHIV